MGCQMQGFIVTIISTQESCRFLCYQKGIALRKGGNHNMKIKILQRPEVKETEVDIICKEETAEIRYLYEHIRGFSDNILCHKDRREAKIPLYQIFYLESVDGKTFVYTEDEVYRYHDTLTSLEETLCRLFFTRISRNVIVNVRKFKYVEPYANHRLLVTMKNNEKLLVCRTFRLFVRNRLDGFPNSKYYDIYGSFPSLLYTSAALQQTSHTAPGR